MAQLRCYKLYGLPNQLDKLSRAVYSRPIVWQDITTGGHDSKLTMHNKLPYLCVYRLGNLYKLYQAVRTAEQLQTILDKEALAYDSFIC